MFQFCQEFIVLHNLVMNMNPTPLGPWLVFSILSTLKKLELRFQQAPSQQLILKQV